jgi:hypothetical protein
MKVQFVLFHTPHAASFCHNCAITSSNESARLRSSLRTVEGGGCVGVRERDRLSRCLRRDRERDAAGEYGEGDVGFSRGAVDVK